MTNENLRFETLKADDKDDVIEFIQTYFRVEEPITRALSASRDDTQPLFEGCWNDASFPVSFAVFDAKNELVAVRLSAIVDFDAKRKRLDAAPNEHKPGPDFGKNGWKIANFLERMEAGIPETVPLTECHLCLKFLILSVRPDHYKQGIAQKLIRASCEKGKELGCTFVTTTATARKSQILFDKKFGFQTLKIIRHDDYVDENGDQIIRCDDGTNCGKTMICPL